jgi:hypothetical protein
MLDEREERQGEKTGKRENGKTGKTGQTRGEKKPLIVLGNYPPIDKRQEERPCIFVTTNFN